MEFYRGEHDERRPWADRESHLGRKVAEAMPSQRRT
jgi:hypothetical protein